MTKSILDPYLGREAGRRVYAGDIRRGDGKTIRSVLFMSDLRGFTSLSDRIPLEFLIAVLNYYFEAIFCPIRARPFTRTVSSTPAIMNTSPTSGLAVMFDSVSSRLLPGRSGITSVFRSVTWTKPGASPRGLTSLPRSGWPVSYTHLTLPTKRIV